MSIQLVLAFFLGTVFLALLFTVACIIAFRKDPTPIPGEAMYFFRVILAVAAAGIGGILPGFLDIEGQILVSLRAGGALALFVFIYLVNPPELISRRTPRPGKLEKRTKSGASAKPNIAGDKNDPNS